MLSGLTSLCDFTEGLLLFLYDALNLDVLLLIEWLAILVYDGTPDMGRAELAPDMGRAELLDLLLFSFTCFYTSLILLDMMGDFYYATETTYFCSSTAIINSF